MTIRRHDAVRTITAALDSAGPALHPANRRALERIRDQLAAGEAVTAHAPAKVRVVGKLGELRAVRGYGP